MENFFDTHNVSRETFELFSRYINILSEWKDKINLVSPNSFEQVWTRHIADSYQLYRFLDDRVNSVYDIGSGAGFPAIVLAIASQTDGRKTRFKLIESITKKTVYLNDVKEKLQLKNVEIINERSENLKLPAADFITARAVANLDKLFGFAAPLADLNTVFLFQKGKKYSEELLRAKNHWLFETEIFKSEVEDEGVVLKLSKLRKKR